MLPLPPIVAPTNAPASALSGTSIRPEAIRHARAMLHAVRDALVGLEGPAAAQHAAADGRIGAAIDAAVSLGSSLLDAQLRPGPATAAFAARQVPHLLHSLLDVLAGRPSGAPHSGLEGHVQALTQLQRQLTDFALRPDAGPQAPPQWAAQPRGGDVLEAPASGPVRPARPARAGVLPPGRRGAVAHAVGGAPRSHVRGHRRPLTTNAPLLPAPLPAPSASSPLLTANTGAPLLRRAGVKIKADSPAQYAHLFPSHPVRQVPKFSTLRAQGQPAAARLTLTSRVDGGTFSKFRHAFTQTGSLVAVKELRLRHKHNPVQGRSYTAVTPLQEATHELRQLLRCRQILDAWVATPEIDEILQSVRSKATPVTIYGTTQDRKTDKLYILMSPEAGSLGAVLARPLTAVQRRHLALSVAAQGFTELTALHMQAKTAHLDLKPENMLFNEDGQLKIMDFGQSAAIRGTAQTTNITGAGIALGTLLAPEWYLYDRSLVGGPPPQLGAASDIWTLALSIARLAHSGPIPGGFAKPANRKTQMMPDGSRRIAQRSIEEKSDEVRPRLTTYTMWRESLPRRADGSIDARVIANIGTYGAFFAPLARLHPELCSLLLTQALVVEPKDRASAQALAAGARALLPRPGSHGQKECIRALRETSAARDLTSLRVQAMQYQAWADEALDAAAEQI